MTNQSLILKIKTKTLRYSKKKSKPGYIRRFMQKKKVKELVLQCVFGAFRGQITYKIVQDSTQKN